VYIREAHPSDAWQMAINVKEEVVFASPKSIEEKTEVAQMCVRKLGIEFPAVVDNFDNSTEVAYSGWPDRLYVIDRQGRIAYKARPGPFGFLPDEMAQTLARLAR
jgi:type I thyroxine 5'-deiodinase